jgi:arylformamidase
VTARWHDISVALDGHLPTWPGSPGVLTKLRNSISQGDAANVTQLSIDVHTGTHVDAPRHFFDHAETLDELGLDPFIGPAIVLDTGPAREVSASVLRAAMIPDDTQRLLLRTVNSSQPDLYSAPFDEDYAALTLDGAEWLAARTFRLVGIDYLSIQRYSEPPDVHHALLGAGVAILEGLSLAKVSPGAYELVCLPMRLVNVEGAPARAVLFPTSQWCPLPSSPMRTP